MSLPLLKTIAVTPPLVWLQIPMGPFIKGLPATPCGLLQWVACSALREPVMSGVDRIHEVKKLVASQAIADEDPSRA